MWRSLTLPGRSLATRMALATLVLLVLLLVIVLVTYAQESRARRDAEIDHAVASGQAIAGMIDGFARDLESTTLATAEYLGALDEITQETAGGTLGRIAADYGLLTGLYVTDVDGTVLASASGNGIDMDTSDRPYFGAMTAGGDTAWTEAIEGQVSGEVVATFARRVETPAGEHRGYLVAGFHPPSLVERLEDQLLQETDVTIFDHLGSGLYSAGWPELLTRERGPVDASAVRHALDGVTARIDREVDLPWASDRYGAVAPVPATGWAVMVTHPLAPLEATLRDRYLQQAIKITAAVVLAGALLTFAAHRLARPLTDLARATEAVERGEQPAIPVVNGRDEVGRLAASIRSMSRAVRDREAALGREVERRRVLSEASSAFIEAGLDLDQQLETVVRLVAETLGDGCAIRLLSADGARLPVITLYHRSPEAMTLAREVLGGHEMAYGEGIPWVAIQTGETQVTAGTPEELFARMPEVHHAYFERYGVTGVLAAPLRLYGESIGVLTAWREHHSIPYTPEDAELLQQIADRAALAIANARLYRRASEYAEAVERAMAAQRELLATVSHDLKNPLASVKGSVQLLARLIRRGDGVDDVELLEMLERISLSVDRATQEIDATVDTARSELGYALTLHRQPMDLVALLDRLCTEQQALTERHTITLEAATSPVPGEWDERRLERAFANLLTNAVKFSPDGGRVTVTVDASTTHATVTVRDEGLGIPGDAIDRIFERFYRAGNVTDRVPGTGLGLSGVRAIVEGHGGTIAVQSVEGTGSTFTVQLPLRDSGDEASTHA